MKSNKCNSFPVSPTPVFLHVGSFSPKQLKRRGVHQTVVTAALWDFITTQLIFTLINSFTISFMTTTVHTSFENSRTLCEQTFFLLELSQCQENGWRGQRPQTHLFPCGPSSLAASYVIHGVSERWRSESGRDLNIRSFYGGIHAFDLVQQRKLLWLIESVSCHGRPARTWSNSSDSDLSVCQSPVLTPLFLHVCFLITM